MGNFFWTLLVWDCERAWKGFNLYLPCGQPCIFFPYDNVDILLRGNCAKCMNCCMQAEL